MPSTPTAPQRSTARRAFLIAIAAIALGALLVTAPATLAPAGAFGWNVGPSGTTVISVTPGLPAERAGIVAGDHIVYETMPLLGRLNTVLATTVHPGATLSFSIEHRGVIRQVTMSAQPWATGLLQTAAIVGLIANLVSMIVALGLVALRPSRMTWAFLVYQSSALVPFAGEVYALHSERLMLAVLTADGIFSGIWTGAAFVFIGRFPSGERAAWATWLDRAAIPWALVVAAFWLYVRWDITYSSAPPPRFVLGATEYLFPAFGAAIILVALVVEYRKARGILRHRIAPVLLTFALATFFGLVWTVVNNLSTDPLLVVGASILSLGFDVAFPVSVAYGVVRYRVMDIDFVVSRTVVYTLLTATIVSTFALIHFLVGKWLENVRIAFALELVVAVAYGVWLSALHSRFVGWVDGVFFRRRHIAESHVLRVAHTLPHAETERFVDEMLSADAAEAFGLASSAVFRRDPDGTFVRRHAVGWGAADAASLERDDHLVVQLAASLAPQTVAEAQWPRSDVPSGLAQPLYAVPVCVRHRVVAIALYGGHASGEALDPDEMRLLRELGAGAAIAYDHIAAAELSDKLRELQTENAALRLALSTLESTLAARQP
jgi:hypothetical protein